MLMTCTALNTVRILQLYIITWQSSEICEPADSTAALAELIWQPEMDMRMWWKTCEVVALLLLRILDEQQGPEQALLPCERARLLKC